MKEHIMVARRIPLSVLMVLFLVGCSPLRGCVESSFEVVVNDRLPVWFTSPIGHEPGELKVELSFYTNGDAVLELYGPAPERVRLDSIVARRSKPADRSGRGGDSYPHFIHLEANGKEDVFAAMRGEPFLFLVDTVANTNEEKAQLLADEVIRRENKLGPNQCESVTRLEALAELSFYADDMERAQKYSKRLLGCDLYPSVAHNAHILYGRALLQADDISAAGTQLVEACKVESAPVLSTFGPSMRLARELLDAGERDVVIDYLDYCQLIWTDDAGKLKKWKKEIRSGKTPDFGFNGAF